MHYWGFEGVWLFGLLRPASAMTMTLGGWAMEFCHLSFCHFGGAKAMTMTLGGWAAEF